MEIKKQLFVTTFLGLFSILNQVSYAAPVGLQNATTDNHQKGYNVSETIDGDFSTSSGFGWSPGAYTRTATAVWETQEDLLGVNTLTFTMHHLFEPNPPHLPQRIRWSVTNDDRSLFADGGSDVDANWVELENLAFTGPDGLIFTDLGDNSYDLGGIIPNNGVITIQASSIISGVTGIRFEALTDIETGYVGFASGYDFVMTELELDAVPSVPEPNMLGLLAIGLGLLGFKKRLAGELKN